MNNDYILVKFGTIKRYRLEHNPAALALVREYISLGVGDIQHLTNNQLGELFNLMTTRKCVSTFPSSSRLTPPHFLTSSLIRSFIIPILLQIS